MNFREERIESLIPLYLGVLGSLVLCAVIYVNTFRFNQQAVETPAVIEPEQEQEIPFLSLAIRTPAPDPIIAYYRNPEFREWVIDFFTDICRNREVAKAILRNACEFDVPVALAFALSWEESNFHPRAVNRSNRDGSIDRGLFQLNNRSFPHLELADFFDVDINASYGIRYLRSSLNTGGTEVSALAMYNAGVGRVTTQGAPRVTLNYISRILNNRSRIENHFLTLLLMEKERQLAEKYPYEVPLQTGRTFISAFPLKPLL